ncbi:MAG: 4-(cytidine 5'-diphospho)-2-C-methyl-D-erythritol kinase, partial [candidate division KSB1 bacterium]|nr:4-(cytidine 5'-diphospho)-2-C-methyl-D-erythritol kinase [candidate division KSB1 bacterium]
MVLTARAYAKINLGLKVCRRRPDGYHDICTIFQQIDLADELAFEVDREAGAIGLLCEGAELPVDERNLVMKAALRLADRVPDKARRTLIVLRKRIPVGGGLGGGSSDAATTLRVLNRAWGANLPEAELLRMARGLGADVPFFLQGGAAFATGIGDVLTPIALWVDPVGVLIVPDVQVSTAWAYGQLKIGLTKRGGCGKFRRFL